MSRREKAEEGLQFVEFILGREYFAVNLFHTREVLTPSEASRFISEPMNIIPVYSVGPVQKIGDIVGPY